MIYCLCVFIEEESPIHWFFSLLPFLFHSHSLFLSCNILLNWFYVFHPISFILLYIILFFFYLFCNTIKSYNIVFYNPLLYLSNSIIFLNISFLMSFLFFLILLKTLRLFLDLWIFIFLQDFGFCFIRWSLFKIFLICFGLVLFWEVVCSMLIYNHFGTSFISQNKNLRWVKTRDMGGTDFLNNPKSILIV